MTAPFRAASPSAEVASTRAAFAPVASGVELARVDPGQLAALSERLAIQHGARLADLFAVQAPSGDLVLRVVYALDAESAYLVLECPVTGHLFPPLSDLDPAAFVEECEIYERHAIRPANGKPLNRVLMAPHLPERPSRRADHARARTTRIHAPHVVRGEAIEFPFGPVRAAGAESLYMGLVTTGEEVLDVYLFLWHKHRGIERRLEGLDPERALFLTERTDGLSAVGNAVAFCRAVEAAAGVDAPVAARHTRSVAMELERIYNHAAAVAALCQATGLSVGQSRSEIVLEELLRLNAAAFGHRYLFGVACPGGVRRAPDAGAIRRLLPAACEELRAVAAALLRTNSHVDRLEATGIVTRADARSLGLVGPVARASGVDLDARRDHPLDPADELLGGVPGRERGDVLARMQVMVAEVEQSERLVLAQLGEAGAARRRCAPRSEQALGWAESVRGEALAWLSFDGDGRIDAARLRPASVRNWRAFDDAARAQNVFTDIPIIEASFWLTAAGFAR